MTSIFIGGPATSSSGSGVVSSGGITPPSPAYQVGYTDLIFGDEFDDPNTIAPLNPKNLTLNSAFKGGNVVSNTLPARMGGYVGSPSYATLIGTGRSNGVPYIDIKWNGTVASGYTLGVFLCDQSINLTAGQVITSSVYIQVIAGSMTNLSGAKLQMDASDSSYGNGTLSGTSSWNQTLTATSTNTRVSVTGTMPTNTNHVSPTFFMSGNGAINVTLRFSALQVEVGSSPTNYQETPLTDYNWYHGSTPLPSNGWEVSNSVLTIKTASSADGDQLQSVFNYWDNFPNKGIFRHGYFEARMRFNPGGWQGGSTAWPAFWMRSLELVASGGTGTELDVMEYYALGSNYPTQPPAYATTLHEWVSGGTHTQNYPTGQLEPNGTVWSDWHTYGCLFTPNSVTWYFDDKPGTTLACGPGTSFPSIETSHLFLILGTGQGWPVDFDWVRVWGSGEQTGKLAYETVALGTGSSYQVQSTDTMIIVNKSSGSATSILLPNNPATGRSIKVKDGKGDAATNNITIIPAAGSIDTSSTYVINANNGFVELLANGNGWSVIDSSVSGGGGGSYTLTAATSSALGGVIVPTTQNLLTVDGSGNLTFNESPTFTGNMAIGGAFATGVTVVTSGSSYTVGANDCVVVINKTSGSATTVTLPATATTGRRITVKDGKGDVPSNNISITPASGNIDGTQYFVLSVSAYQSQDFVFNGTQWNKI